MRIKIGTRGSKLALWQAYHVENILRKNGAETKIITIDTKGDKILDVSISKIGSKGVFTEEIEDQLADGKIDIAVHSAKDMQSELPAGFELIAFGQREKANDIILSKSNVDLASPNIKIGTSSTRRIAFLKKYYPSVQAVPVRGNLQTRIKKMEEGQCHALLLAYAGVHRMGYDADVRITLAVDQFTPAVGQGSIAIEVSNDLESDKKEFVRKCINHQETEIAILAERAYLRKMQGGCSIPIFGYARLDSEKVTLHAGIISLDGNQMVTSKTEASILSPEDAGISMGDYILENGGASILEAIRKEQNTSV